MSRRVPVIVEIHVNEANSNYCSVECPMCVVAPVGEAEEEEALGCSMDARFERTDGTRTERCLSRELPSA